MDRPNSLEWLQHDAFGCFRRFLVALSLASSLHLVAVAASPLIMSEDTSPLLTHSNGTLQLPGPNYLRIATDLVSARQLLMVAAGKINRPMSHRLYPFRWVKLRVLRHLESNTPRFSGV